MIVATDRAVRIGAIGEPSGDRPVRQATKRRVVRQVRVRAAAVLAVRPVVIGVTTRATGVRVRAAAVAVSTVAVRAAKVATAAAVIAVRDLARVVTVVAALPRIAGRMTVLITR